MVRRMVVRPMPDSPGVEVAARAHPVGRRAVTTLVHVTANFLGPNNTPGIWAFHCHILTHAEGPNGMFGMVTTFIVEP